MVSIVVFYLQFFQIEFPGKFYPARRTIDNASNSNRSTTMLTLEMTMGDSSFHGLPTGTTYEVHSCWESKEGIRYGARLSGERCMNGFWHLLQFYQLSHLQKSEYFEVLLHKFFRKEATAKRKLKALTKVMTEVRSDLYGQPQRATKP